MAGANADIVVRHVRGLASLEESGRQGDAELLTRYCHGGDEVAFAVLVKRHGPLVWGVCRRVLGDHHDAEDAFQAAFLALARRAGSVARAGAVSGWLYRVAYHTATRARVRAASRREHERQAPPPALMDPLAEITGRELLAVLDEELHKLPEKCRMPLVLCYLEGCTRDEAAKQLGWPLGTLKHRLEQGRARLRGRLTRRGLALPGALLAAGLCRAAVPAALAARVMKVALLTAAGGAGAASADVLSLADGALRAVTGCKVKAYGALLLAVGLALAGAGSLGRLVPPPPAAPGAGMLAAAPRGHDVLAAGPADVAPGRMTLTGRVLGPDDRPLPGAELAVLGWPRASHRGGDLAYGLRETLGRARTDVTGNFKIDLPRTSSATHALVFVFAAAGRHGLGWAEVNPDTWRRPVDVRVLPSRALRGRLLDLQGQPAAGVAVHVVRIGNWRGASPAPSCDGQPGGLPLWPRPAVTDEQGWFELPGLGAHGAMLSVHDDRFALQHVVVPADAKPVTTTLAPARQVEGVVTCADTGRPVAGARLTVYAGGSSGMYGIAARADGEGRFRVNPAPGPRLVVTAYPPDGSSYLAVRKEMEAPRARVRQRVEVVLPRGVLVHGRVSEAGSGRPVAGASIQYWPLPADGSALRAAVTGSDGIVLGGADGTFSIAVPPGRGHLLVHDRDGDCVLRPMDSNRLYDGRPGGRRVYAHAFVPLQARLEPTPPELAVTLRRGVTVRGPVVGPDGRPVAEGLVLDRGRLVAPISPTFRAFATPMHDGRFEVHGIDPDGSLTVFFVDPKNRLGAVAALSGRHAGREVTIRLAPCGAATVRFVREGGKPLAGHDPMLELVFTPGPFPISRKVHEGGQLAADTDFVCNFDRLNHWQKYATGADGRLTLPALIPGATYRLGEFAYMDDAREKGFHVEAGQTLDLGDVRVTGKK
jgi:RNA polymerase sigma factor (sigma-70 family)